MDDVKIYEHEWVANNVNHKMAILWGAMRKENPTSYMNAAVAEYVSSGRGHNQFIEITMDNPWIRLLVTDINSMPFIDFTNQRF